MMAALEAAYKGTLMQGKFPGCVLSLSMPAQLVDVNVHPAKTEVRFAREKDAFDAVYSAVKSALMQKDASHQMFAFGSGEEGDAVGQEAYAWPQPEGNVSPQPSAHRPAPGCACGSAAKCISGVKRRAHGGVRAYGEMLSSLASAPPCLMGADRLKCPLCASTALILCRRMHSRCRPRMKRRSLPPCRKNLRQNRRRCPAHSRQVSRFAWWGRCSEPILWPSAAAPFA